MIRLSSESIEAHYRQHLETVFEHLKHISAEVRTMDITRENT